MVARVIKPMVEILIGDSAIPPIISTVFQKITFQFIFIDIKLKQDVLPPADQSSTNKSHNGGHKGQGYACNP